MKQKILSLIAILILATATISAQENAPKPTLKKVYNESIDPIEQIDNAIQQAQKEHKNIICQVGGNWCIWCLRFADFIENDEEIATIIKDNYIYIHVNYPRDGSAKQLLQRLGYPHRFGYPALVVLDENGNIIHIQDSVFLEEGKGYNKARTLRFFKGWTPSAVAGN